MTHNTNIARIFHQSSIALALLWLSFFFINAEAEPLPIDKAFNVYAMSEDNGDILLRWHIAPGYQIYRDSLVITNAKIVKWPASQLFKDSLGHGKKVYTHEITFHAERLSNPNTPIFVNFQGCHGTLQCYPPQHLTFNLSKLNQWQAPSQTKANDSHMVFSLLGFFVGGLLLAFTPCVLPLLPVLAGILFGQHSSSIRRKLSVASIYVMSMATAYALAGLLAAWLGYSIQATLQHPSTLIIFALILGTMGVFMWMDKPPSWLSGRLTPDCSTQKWYTPMLLGATTLLVASPCTTPAFIAALTYITTTGNTLLGGLGLFLLGLGMGLPILIVAILGVEVLPKSGAWLNTTKKLGAILLLTMSLWIGSRGVIPFLTPTTPVIAHQSIQTSAELNATIQRIHDANIPLILFYTADWCSICQSLEQKIFNNAEVIKSLGNTAIARVNISNINTNTKALMRPFHVIAPPTLIILKPNFERSVLIGNVSPSKLLDFLK